MNAFPKDFTPENFEAKYRIKISEDIKVLRRCVYEKVVKSRGLGIISVSVLGEEPEVIEVIKNDLHLMGWMVNEVRSNFRNEEEHSLEVSKPDQ